MYIESSESIARIFGTFSNYLVGLSFQLLEFEYNLKVFGMKVS